MFCFYSNQILGVQVASTTRSYKKMRTQQATGLPTVLQQAKYEISPHLRWHYRVYRS